MPYTEATFSTSKNKFGNDDLYLQHKSRVIAYGNAKCNCIMIIDYMSI